MRPPLLHLASQVFDTPLAIVPEKLDLILRTVGPRLVVDQAALADLTESGLLRRSRSACVGPTFAWQDADADETRSRSNKSDKPYQMTDAGIAVIPISGTLMKTGSWMSAVSGAASYTGLEASFRAAVEDNLVKGILLDVNSPGGVTHGCFELTDLLYSLRGSKPISAVANDMACSAAYALASCADKLWVTRTGSVGSIGVFSLHMDRSAADKADGLKYTYIHFGERKTEGNEHQPISDEALERCQAEVDRQGEMFVQAVARNRGVTAKSVLATKAGIENGQNALGLLADAVGTYSDALVELTKKVTKNSKISNTGTAGKEASAMPAIPAHKTATSTKTWNGPAAKKNLLEGKQASYYRAAYAFAKPDGDPATKAGYSYIHHEVSSSGAVGAANVKGCQSSIGVLNGGRGGTVLKGSDRSGVYNHVAKHLRDAGLEPSPLASQSDYLTNLVAFATKVGDNDLQLTAESELAALVLIDLEAQMAKKKEMDEKEEKATSKSKKAGLECDDEERMEAKGKEPEDGEDEEDDEEDEDDEKEKKAAAEDDEKDEDEKPEPKDKKPAKGKKAEADYMRKGKKAESPDAGDYRAQVEEISMLCDISGFKSMAADFILAGTSVTDVRKALRAKRAAASTEDNAVASQFGVASVSNLDSLQKQARAAQAGSGGTLNFAQAMEKVLLANPGIYNKIEDERARVAMQGTPSDRAAYVEKLKPQLAAMGLSTQLG